MHLRILYIYIYLPNTSEIFRGIVRLNRPKHRSFPSMTRFSIWFLFLLKQRLSQSQQRNSYVASQHHTDIEVKQLTIRKNT